LPVVAVVVRFMAVVVALVVIEHQLELLAVVLVLKLLCHCEWERHIP
jgi:hypothetical protein